MNVIRSFIAISLSAEIYEGLDQVIAGLRDSLPDAPLRWVPARNIHLTLKFLGSVSEANLGMLEKTLNMVAGQHSAFEMSVGGFGAFPSIHRPRVLWVGVEASRTLQDVQSGIEYETSRLGYPKEDRPFSPHLTIARASRNAPPSEIKLMSQIISKYEVGFLGAFRVEEIHLYRSDLLHGGAVYTRLFSVRLQ